MQHVKHEMYILHLTSQHKQGLEDARTLITILKPVERKILNLAAQGHPDKAIARELGITYKSVGSHIKRMRDRFRQFYGGQEKVATFRDRVVPALAIYLFLENPDILCRKV